MTSRPPTNAELSILQVLWAKGPSTVRTVHEQLHQEQSTPTAYTTTLKLMQIMHDKKLLQRDASQRSHVYAATISEEQAQDTLLSGLLDKAFDGSASRMLMRALSVKRSSKEEIDEIRALLDQYEQGGKRP